MKASGAWYAQGGSKLRELCTIMHLPYTSMVLSYVLIGAALSPILYPNRVVLTLVAYFLGLGLSAHALNELHANHWTEALGKRELMILFVVSLVAAIAIGAYAMLELSMLSNSVVPPSALLGFIILETFFLFTYNTDAVNGVLCFPTNR